MRILKAIPILLLFLFAAPFAIAQPVISYIIPDLGTPGMNTYIEIIGPYNLHKNFGTDGFSLNNSGDAVQVVCATASDSQYVRFGPCVVSWDGRMISTQVFVMPWIVASSVSWKTGITIPIQVMIGGVRSKTVGDFFIVRPQNLGTVGVLSNSGALGSGLKFTGNFGVRSPRGAMIVDSFIVSGITNLTIDTSDCDLSANGNQGFLPAIIISKGAVNISASAIISASAAGTNGGPGGGGGGDGLTCSNQGGNGFTGGGGNIDMGNNSGCQDRPRGIGSGDTSAGLNSVPAGKTSPGNEGGGGGTGHPFGMSGGAGLDSSGYGGGAGGPECCIGVDGGGGGGNYAGGATNGGTYNHRNKDSIYTAGKPVGNSEIVPFAGGSGGGAGNVNSFPFYDAGNGGGGGGAIAIFGSNISALGPITSTGGAGSTSGEPNGSGGGGSGGAIVLGSKGPMALNSFDVLGGFGGPPSNSNANQSGGNGGVGRVRLDGLTSSTVLTVTKNASVFSGPTTDTSDIVSRTFTLTGTENNGNDVQIFLRSLSSPWSLAATISGYAFGQPWSQVITLPGTDSVYLLCAAAKISSANSSDFTAEPSFVLSQSGANILRICTPMPRLKLTQTITVETDSVSFFPIIAEDPSMKSVSDCNIVLQFANSDLINIIGVDATRGSFKGAVTHITSAADGIHIGFSLPGPVTFQPGDTMCYVQCSANVTSVLSTTATLASATFSGFFQAAACQSLAPDSNTMSFAVLPRCGEESISRSMAGLDVLFIEHLAPNPTSSKINVQLHILKNYSNTGVLEIYDALGNLEQKLPLQFSEYHPLENISLAIKESGVHYVRVTSSSGISTKMVVVEK